MQDLRVSLIQRFLTDQLEFVNVAKDFVDFDDFADLADRIVFPAGSHGKLGGKAPGLILARGSSSKARARRRRALWGEIKFPKTWYLTSDGLLDFIAHNDLEDVWRAEVQGHRRDPPRVPQHPAAHEGLAVPARHDQRPDRGAR